MLRRKRKIAHRNSKLSTRDENCKPVSGNTENLQDDDCCIIEVKKKDCDSPWRNIVKKNRKFNVGNEDDIVSVNGKNLHDDDCHVIDDPRAYLDIPCKQAEKDVLKMNGSVESGESYFSSRNSCVVTEEGDECYVVYDSKLSRPNLNLRSGSNISGKTCICSSAEANDKFIASIIPTAYSDPQAKQILALHEGNDIENRLDMEEVALDFEPCILHQLHGSSMYISLSRIQELREQGIPIRNGKWSKQEDTILLRNWNNIVEKYQIDNPVLLLGLYRGINGVLKKFIRAKKVLLHLGKDLNDRSLVSIYFRARRMLDVWNYRGRLSEEEKEKLLKLHGRLGNQWTKIAVLMNRPSVLCCCTTRLLLGSKRKGEWTAEEDRLLLKSVKRHVGREKWMTKYRRYPWNKIAQDVCGRNIMQCRMHWLTCLCWKPKLFVRPKWKKRDAALLIYLMYIYMVEAECFIDWDMLYEKFKTSVSSYVSLQNKWHILKRKVPDFTSKDHESVVIYLYKKYLPKILKSCKISMSDLDHIKNSKS